MLDQKQFISAITQIAEDKGIPEDKVIEVVEMAISAAYKKDYGKRGQMIRVDFIPKTGNMKFFQLKLVVDESVLREEKEDEDNEEIVSDNGKSSDREANREEKAEEYDDEDGEKKIKFNAEKHIMIDEAKKLLKKKEASLVSRTQEIEQTEDKVKELKNAKREKGDDAARKVKNFDYIETPLESKDIYGRIAAQTAKQVIMQRIREAEREVIFGEYKSKEGEVVSGIVQRVERGNVFVDIGKTTGVMFFGEQIPHERYRIGQRLRALIIKVERDAKGSLIVLSRSHPKMVMKLFEFEVPEIESGSVEIKAIAREAGSRSKVAVVSSAEGVDPVGSCVGQKGTRVATIINELGGEKIDIIAWNESPEKFIANALSPAKIIGVKVTEEKKEARVEVDEDQLSLAIGKSGQNVRLAAKLTGWRIDIVSGEKKVSSEETEEEMKEEGKKAGVEEGIVDKKKEKANEEVEIPPDAERKENKKKESEKAVKKVKKDKIKKSENENMNEGKDKSKI